MLLAAALLACGTALAEPEVLDLTDAARLLRLPPATVEQMAGDGRLPGRAVEGRWRFSRAALMNWLAGRDSEPMPAADLGRTTGRQQAPAAPTVGEQPTVPTAEAIALRDQGGVLRRGSGSVEIGFSYARSEQSLFPVVRSETATTTANGVLRYVPVDGVQLSARLPYVSQKRSQFTDITALAGPAEVTTRSDGRGDANLSLLTQLLRERGGRPNVLLSLEGLVAADASRSNGLGASLLLTKSVDPAVLFAGLSYLQALDADRVDERNGLARHNYGLNLGYTYALNDVVALNAVFAGSYRNYRTETRGALAGTLPPPRESYALQFGATWMVARGLFVEPAIAVRIGGDRPDMTFTLNLPWTF